MKIGRNNPCPCGSGKKYKKCCLKKDEIFLVGEDIFYSQIEPLYKDCEFDINRFLEFEISLPFQIALEDKSLFSFVKESCILHYFYKTHEREEVIVEHKDLIVKKYYTSVVVAISYDFLIHKEEESYRSIQNKLFDYLLDELNKQIIAYVTSTKDDSCFRINKEMLFPIILMNIVNLGERKRELSLFTINMNVPYKKESIKHKNINDCLRLYNIYNEQLNPLIHSESYVLKANRKLREGYYDEAIISIQTNIEILIRIIYREVLFDSGMSEVDIENKLEDKSFMSIVKKELQKYIGGTWDVTREETPIWNWYHKTYKIRNKIVHAGYYPTFEEVCLAIDSAKEFRNCILERVRKNKSKYLRLNDYFILVK